MIEGTKKNSTKQVNMTDHQKFAKRLHLSDSVALAHLLKAYRVTGLEVGTDNRREVWDKESFDKGPWDKGHWANRK